jgi:hypothetical protein
VAHGEDVSFKANYVYPLFWLRTRRDAEKARSDSLVAARAPEPTPAAIQLIAPAPPAPTPPLDSWTPSIEIAARKGLFVLAGAKLELGKRGKEVASLRRLTSSFFPEYKDRTLYRSLEPEAWLPAGRHDFRAGVAPPGPERLSDRETLKKLLERPAIHRLLLVPIELQHPYLFLTSAISMIEGWEERDRLVVAALLAGIYMTVEAIGRSVLCRFCFRTPIPGSDRCPYHSRTAFAGGEDHGKRAGTRPNHRFCSEDGEYRRLRARLSEPRHHVILANCAAQPTEQGLYKALEGAIVALSESRHSRKRLQLPRDTEISVKSLWIALTENIDPMCRAPEEIETRIRLAELYFREQNDAQKV